MKLKVRTEFPNVWGEYKYHSNPYIQGTTIPCDKCAKSSESLNESVLGGLYLSDPKNLHLYIFGLNLSALFF